MDNDRFDALTRALGAGRSRRGIVKGLAAAALGAGGLSKLGAAEAASNKNSACAQFCAAVFGADTPAAGQCTSQGAHGTGPCLACANNPAAYCTGTCVDLASDVTNCGACGTVCDDGDACTTGTCVAGACVTTEIGGLGAACTQPDFHDGAPMGTPGEPCCGGLVCNGCGPAYGLYTCNQNHAPVAFDRNILHPWMFDCIPYTLIGYDPDGDAIGFELVTQPSNGFLTEFVAAVAGASYAAAAPGVRALTAGPLFHTDAEASASGFQCLDGSIAPQPRDSCGNPDNGLVAWAGGTHPFASCPEGVYSQATLCYVTFNPTFTGTDAFTYRAIDVFGAVSAPALATLTVFEV